jgi:hypothetical protein
VFPGFSSSAERNYYEILGVPENASRDDIKKAFHAVRTFLEFVFSVRCRHVGGSSLMSYNSQFIYVILYMYIGLIACQKWAYM